MSFGELIGYLVLAIYILALLYITFYCLMQFHLLLQYRKSRWHQPARPKQLTDYPVVTVQLPIYNERYVVNRLIDRICALDYPKDKLEIQVLDDSTDDTVDLSRRKVEAYRAQGFDIKLITRTDRTGYKAGALQHGLRSARGAFIAIFDADFLPRADFLTTTLPFFRDDHVGVVQTKWEHINQDYSLITQLQAFQLNVHFTVEQSGRQAGAYMLQFNGTAGVWRRATIDDAGGWQSDTLTEDLDLSYRAQLRGWKIRYLEFFGSPAELPAEMNGLKSQQFRWMKGGAETARKMLPTVWKSDLTSGQKVHASLHLLSSTVFVFVFILGVLSVPVSFLIKPLGVNIDYLTVSLLSFVSIIAIYYVANVKASWGAGSKWRKLLKFILLFPLFLSLSMGLSLHNTVAVIQGYLGRKSPFVRTPKFNIQSLTDRIGKRSYLARKLPFTTLVEGLLALYFLAAVIIGIALDDTSFIFFHILLMFGYGTICYYSIRHLSMQ
ncbi:MAG: glycosyltransferase family 2 protein [Saprospiraceae bacterium]|nr:glycosyltransferase family 2 protein [Saprospiraceae bacterium]